MELYLAAAAAFLLPLLLQCWLLPLGRKRPRLRFTRWLPLLGSAVFAALAINAAGRTASSAVSMSWPMGLSRP